MEQPEGFETGENLVCLLLKSLYGLKQAARIWNQKIRHYLMSIGFQQTHSDHCIYINKTSGIIIAMWVDDLLIFGKDINGINSLKQQLRQEFEMNDLGELKYFLDMQVHRNRDKSSYISTKQGTSIWCWNGSIWKTAIQSSLHSLRE